MFCDKCGSILMPGEDSFFCSQCGTKGGNVDLSDESTTNVKEVHMVSSESNDETLPKATAECPKCQHNEAYFFVRQTRSADESPTAFYTCCKCEHKWRDYD